MIDFDFHSHTSPQSHCASQSVQELVRKAHASGIKVLSVCNHDTLNGLAEAREECGKYGIEFVNGVELTCNIMGESSDLNGTMVHILGYNIDNNSKLFNSYVNRIRKEYEKRRVLKICGFLRSKGLAIEDCTETNRLLSQMVDKDIYNDIESAERYINSEEMALVFPYPRLTHKQAIGLIHKLNGLAVWAHPTRIWLHDRFSDSELEEVVDRFCVYGLDGLEVFHPNNLKEGAISTLLRIAESRNLKVSLGSDTHHLQDADGYFPLNDELNNFDFGFEKIKYFWKKQ